MPTIAAVRTGTFVLLVGAGCLSAAASESPQLPAGVQGLGWLAGCWERTTGATVIEEQWMRPRGRVMLGVGRTTRRDTVVEFEQLRIFERGGRSVYAALPSGQSLAEFEAATTSDSLVTFENPAHDFPQRIIYRRRGADSLIARIEGTRGGQVRGVDFPYRRVACP
jgi:hypothetical protein